MISIRFTQYDRPVNLRCDTANRSEKCGVSTSQGGGTTRLSTAAPGVTDFRADHVPVAMAATSKPSRLETGDELDDFVDAHDVALVEFYTSGCAMCQAMEPVLGNVARATDVAIGMVNPATTSNSSTGSIFGRCPRWSSSRTGRKPRGWRRGSRAATPSPSSWPSTFRTPSVPTDRIRFVTAAHCSSPRTLIIARSYSPSMSDEDGADFAGAVL